MAGAFTHWMIVDDAVEKLQDNDYAIILGEKRNFVRIGAVAPDYPYLSELQGKWLKIHSWADRMHYENSLEFVKNGLSELLSEKDPEKFKVLFAWLCGYVSHLIADTIIHPVVNVNVGGTYIFTSHDHVICEMTQDAKLFFEIKGVDLSNAEYVKLLSACSDPADNSRIHQTIREYWPKILTKTHPNAGAYFDKIDPDKWHAAYLSKLGMAAKPVPIFRHVGEDINIVYKTEIELRNSDLERKYYLSVKLPKSQEVGTFKDRVFNKTVEKVVEVWQKIFSDVSAKQTSNCQNYLCDWNLDTGLDENEIHFW
jgi:hypothetical protein